MPSADDIHFDISWEAARIANQMMVEDSRIPPQFFNVWNPSGQRNLGIVFDPGMLRLDPKIVKAMQEIGREAMRRAIVENGHLLAGLIVGEARKRHNYFDKHHPYANI